MHMSDALLSPAVGGAMTVVSAAAIGYSVKKISGGRLDEKKIPMMGVMGAFVFAAQMVNFTIPGTGSSGHIGGGILLAAILGPYPAFLTLASVLLIQCLLFADGGLLAYGCNLWNIGACTCLLAYPLIFEPLVKRGITNARITAASVLAAVIGLQTGAFCVVLQTCLSGVAELPVFAFAALMQPIHLAIGLIEGLVTAAALVFIHSTRPELLHVSDKSVPDKFGYRKPLIILLALTVIVGVGLSLISSSLPDGLEWSVEKAAGGDEIEREGKVYSALAGVVDATAVMPDYSLPANDNAPLATSAAGLIGSAVTIILAGGTGLVVHLVRRKTRTDKPEVN